jgi:hypothetical protein
VTDGSHLYTFAETAAILKSIVEEFGADYVDPNAATPGGVAPQSCIYADQDAPRCIVGQFLGRAGVAVPKIAALDGGIDELVDHSSGEFPVSLTEKAYELLLEAQKSQDVGSAWGEALASATADRFDLRHADDTEPFEPWHE